MRGVVRAIIAEDHQLVLSGFRRLLAEIQGVEVVGEATNGLDAVALARSERADLVVMDIAMAGLNGIDATMAIKAERPETHVVIVSMHGTEEFVHRALRAGASAYLVKECAPMELRLAVEAVLRGDVYLTPRVSRQVVAELMAKDRRHASDDLELLTLRQRQILQLIVEGKATKQIAQTLGVSVKTVETHRAAIMQRLGIHHVAGLVLFGIRHKLVALDPADPDSTEF
jgi:DNA-binding NarL/FixJ family response regulator